MASIRKRGNSYLITVSHGYDIHGKKLYETATWKPDQSRTERQNKKALETFAFEFEQKVLSGKYLDGEKITFQDFSDIWLKEYAQPRLAPATVASYELLLHKHINPEIGHLKMSRIQPKDLNRLYLSMQHKKKDNGSDYSPATIHRLHATLSTIFSTAVKWNIILDNPCSRISPPRQALNDDIKYFTIEQAEAFLEALERPITSIHKEHDRVDDTGIKYHVDTYTEQHPIQLQYKVFFQMALFGGLRNGELIALQWSDIDFGQHTISITKSTGVVNGKIITKEPKNKSSIRNVTLPESIFDLLRQLRIEQLRTMMDIGDQWEGARPNDTGYLFTQWNGKQMYPKTPYHMFKRIISNYNRFAPADAQLPDIPLHGLRHTSATLLISQNLDVRSVSARLGHAQTSTTINIYSHALKKKDQEASDIMESLFLKNA